MDKDINVMPDFSQLLNKKALILELDDAIFPRCDFVLQVYYLFANFVEFTLYEPAANALLETMKNYYEEKGEEGLFEYSAQKFPEISAYKSNFDRLHHQAQLPLKLLLKPEVRDLIQQFQQENKAVMILTAGDPLMQLNKIKQIDWQGLERQIKIYFEDELRFTGMEPLRYVLEELGLEEEEVGFVRSAKSSD